VSLACGIDVGGTKIAGGVVDEHGTILEELRVESPATDVPAIEAAIEKLVTELSTRHAIEAVGVGAAGHAIVWVPVTVMVYGPVACATGTLSG